MKFIPLSEAYQILEDCSAVIVDGVVTYPRLSDLEGQEENEFLCLRWTDDEGQDYSVAFAEGENVQVRVENCSMYLVDTDGEVCPVVILVPKRLE